MGCRRGEKYFCNQETDNLLKSLNEQVIEDLKKCGHLLHHNRDLDLNELLSCFSEKKLNELHELLSKIK